MSIHRSPLLWMAALLSGAILSSQGFVEKAASVGLHHEFLSGADYVGTLKLWDMLQQGISLGDIDGDGDVDVVACGGLGNNTVFRNDGGFFTDITDRAGINVGEFDRVAPLGDVDGDGDLDVWVGVLEGGDGPIPGKGRLYLNNGTGVFTEVTALAGIPGGGHSLFAQWVDLDRDGLLDLYVCEFHGAPNLWYRNNGDGSFTEQSVQQGIAHDGSAHVSAVADLDDDGFPDLVVGNDHTISKIGKLLTQDVDGLYHGQNDSTLIDLADFSGADTLGGIMGLALGDVNYDGLFDIYKTDINDNSLLINNGWPGSGLEWTSEQFTYGIANEEVPCAGCPGGVAKSSGWAAVFFHADLDPWLDLFVVNGQVAGLSSVTSFTTRDQQNYLYRGLGPGASFTFEDASATFALDSTIDDRVLALGDMDDDGDPDLLVGPTTGDLRYYENLATEGVGGWVGVTVETNVSAPGGIGTRVRWVDGFGYPHTFVIGADGTTASQNEQRVFLAIGGAPTVDLLVNFPSGYTQAFPAVAAGSEIVAVEPKFIRPSARTLPIAGATTGSGTSTDPSGTSPLGMYIVTADAAPFGGADLVTIGVPGLTAISDVLDLGGDVYRRYFAAPETPGTFRARVRFDDTQILIEPKIHFYDPTDASGTGVTVAPEAVRAGSSDTAVMTFAPKTVDGISLGAGRTVSLASTTLSILDGPTDMGDGRYEAVVGAPATAGFHFVDFLLDGAVVATATLEAGGTVDQAMTELRFEDPVEVQSAAPDRARLYITPRDAAGFRLGPKASVSVDPIEDLGMPEVTVRGDLWSEGRRDGSYFFVMDTPPGLPDGAVTGDFQITIDGVAFTLQPFAI